MERLSRAMMVAAFAVLGLGSVVAPATTSAAATCGDRTATIVGKGVIRGTRGNDVIVGSASADRINGGGGNDVICGLGGGDLIHGGLGVDLLFGGDGIDRVYGDGGNDIINTGENVDGDTAYGGAGNDVFDETDTNTIDCDGAPTSCTATNHIYGEGGDDRLLAMSWADFHGGPGNDRAEGMGRLNGDDGDDQLLVAWGIAYGGSGKDTLTQLGFVSYLDGGRDYDLCRIDRRTTSLPPNWRACEDLELF